jgi:hypothetical protein
VLIVTYVSDLSSAPVIPAPILLEGENASKDRSLSYLLGFAAVGLFFSVLSFVLTPPEWISEGAMSVALASF